MGQWELKATPELRGLRRNLQETGPPDSRKSKGGMGYPGLTKASWCAHQKPIELSSWVNIGSQALRAWRGGREKTFWHAEKRWGALPG